MCTLHVVFVVSSDEVKSILCQRNINQMNRLVDNYLLLLAVYAVNYQFFRNVNSLLSVGDKMLHVNTP